MGKRLAVLVLVVLVVAAPGPNPIDHTTLPYKRLRPGIRLMPMGPEFRLP